MSTVKSAARSEQNMQPPVNLASLPRDEALERARAAGSAILVDSDAVSAVFRDLWTNWMNTNIPNACGQSEDEFGDLVNSMMSEFETGMNAFVCSATDAERTLERVGVAIQDDSRFAWKIYNVLAWMVEGLPDDAAGALPVRCTAINLRQDVEKLATSLMDLVHEARHG
jgi:hypothetical protein